METMSTPPGNTFHQLNLAGGYALAAKTKLAGNFSYGVNTQNQAYAVDAFMFVPGSLATGNTLASVNAKVNTTHADLKLTNQSIKDHNGSADYRRGMRVAGNSRADRRAQRTASIGGTVAHGEPLDRCGSFVTGILRAMGVALDSIVPLPSEF